MMALTQRCENVIVGQGVEWHICDCVPDDIRINHGSVQNFYGSMTAVLQKEFLFSILRCPFQLKWCQTYLCGMELQCQSRKRKLMRQSSGGF